MEKFVIELKNCIYLERDISYMFRLYRSLRLIFSPSNARDVQHLEHLIRAVPVTEFIGARDIGASGYLGEHIQTITNQIPPDTIQYFETHHQRKPLDIYEFFQRFFYITTVRQTSEEWCNDGPNSRVILRYPVSVVDLFLVQYFLQDIRIIWHSIETLERVIGTLALGGKTLLEHIRVLKYFKVSWDERYVADPSFWRRSGRPPSPYRLPVSVMYQDCELRALPAAVGNVLEMPLTGLVPVSEINHCLTGLAMAEMKPVGFRSLVEYFRALPEHYAGPAIASPSCLTGPCIWGKRSQVPLKTAFHLGHVGVRRLSSPNLSDDG